MQTCRPESMIATLPPAVGPGVLPNPLCPDGRRGSPRALDGPVESDGTHAGTAGQRSSAVLGNLATWLPKPQSARGAVEGANQMIRLACVGGFDDDPGVPRLLSASAQRRVEFPGLAPCRLRRAWAPWPASIARRSQGSA